MRIFCPATVVPSTRLWRVQDSLTWESGTPRGFRREERTPHWSQPHDSARLAGREVTSLLPHALGASRIENRRTPPITSRRGPREHCGLVCSHPTLTRFPWARQQTHRVGDTAAGGLQWLSPIPWIMGVTHRSPVRSNLYSMSSMSQQGKSRACPRAVRQSNPRFSTP